MLTRQERYSSNHSTTTITKSYLIIHQSSIINYQSLPITHYPLPITHYSLIIVRIFLVTDLRLNIGIPLAPIAVDTPQQVVESEAPAKQKPRREE